jgi:hypothetical protein
MKRFQESAAGRILAVAVALPLAAGALVTMTPEGSGVVWIIASVFAGIVLGIIGVGLAVEEYAGAAVGALLFLPPALLLYTPIVAFGGGSPVVRVVMGFTAATLLLLAVGQASFRMRWASSPRASTRSA